MFAGPLQSALDCNVLVLNKHYMAVRIVGARRAFSLLCRDLAEVVSLEEGSYSIEIPSPFLMLKGMELLPKK